MSQLEIASVFPELSYAIKRIDPNFYENYLVGVFRHILSELRRKNVGIIECNKNFEASLIENKKLISIAEKYQQVLLENREMEKNYESGQERLREMSRKVENIDALISELSQKHEEEKKNMCEKHNEKLAEITRRHEIMVEDLNTHITSLEQLINFERSEKDATKRMLEGLPSEYERMHKLLSREQQHTDEILRRLKEAVDFKDELIVRLTAKQELDLCRSRKNDRVDIFERLGNDKSSSERVYTQLLLVSRWGNTKIGKKIVERALNLSSIDKITALFLAIEERSRQREQERLLDDIIVSLGFIFRDINEVTPFLEELYEALKNSGGNIFDELRTVKYPHWTNSMIEAVTGISVLRKNTFRTEWLDKFYPYWFTEDDLEQRLIQISENTRIINLTSDQKHIEDLYDSLEEQLIDSVIYTLSLH